MGMSITKALRICALGALAVFSVLAHGTGGDPKAIITAADYARAEKFLSANATPLVFRAGARPVWLPDDRFWYRNTIPEGTEFVLVNPRRSAKGPAFDQAKVAAALSAASGQKVDAFRLPFAYFVYSQDGRTISFNVGGRRWSCGVQGEQCIEIKDSRPATQRNESVSPDGRLSVFIRNDNLWLRELATGAEKQLTTDGVKDYGYATDNAGWSTSDRAIVLWSPDSKKIATFQQDQRGVGEMYLVETKVGRPRLQAWKCPLPGDKAVTMIERVIIHIDGPRVVRLKMSPDQHRGTITDNITNNKGELEDAQWSSDSIQFAFVSTSRDHKEEQLRVADANTGEVRVVLSEKVATFFESGINLSNWRYLPASGEVIWYSQRDNWGQLYLYDLRTGRIKHQITSGEGNVAQLLKVDEKNRLLFFMGVGKEKGRDPYFRHLYRIGFDGKNLTLLSPENADHEGSLSPSGRYFVDSYSTPETPQEAVLRDASGKRLLALEKADITRLLETGWKPPVPFTVKARDGVTDLYGLMFKPTNLDPSKKYPIINNIYPGPQTGSVSGRSFSAARSDAQALAELGFIVIQLDGLGTPWRSKKFHEAYYGDMGDNTLPDQITGMKQLAERFQWIDIDRVGIYGGSGGGFASTAAILKYPDFFKVAVSTSGNHDNRGYEDDWGEKWQGLLELKPDGTSNYDSQANQNYAKNLKGKLLIAHGSMDSNVPPYNTLLVVDALIAANKDFDMIIFPNRGHGLSEPYMVRKRWDYFVKHLLGAEPPKEYAFNPAPRR